VSNPYGILLQVSDPTDGGVDNGRFDASTDDVNSGDSGGPYYYQGRVFGTTTGHGTDWTGNTYTAHTSIATHLDWILATTGYTWIGTPPKASTIYDGTLLQVFVGTQRVCQYACQNTASCEAYNYSGSSCSLYTNVTGAHTQAGWTGALHYGASTGNSNQVVGYLRSDGYSSVLHKAIDGGLHEIYRKGGNWNHGSLPLMAGEPIAGRLSAYRRADGINAVLYRSTHGRVIEVALASDGWHAAALTDAGGSLAAGDPLGYVRADGVSAVVFRSSNGHINELRLGTKGWIPTDLSVESNGTALPAASDPSPFVRADGLSSVVYRSGGAIIELYKSPTEPWHWGGPSSLAHHVGNIFGIVPEAAGRPYGYTRRNGVEAIVYRSTQGRLIELRNEDGWWYEDITASGQTLAGDPVAHVRTDAVESIVYRSTSSQIDEVTRPPLAAWNLSAQYGVAQVFSDPAVFILDDRRDSVLYGLWGNQVGTLLYDVGYGWATDNLTLASGETP
jgi:hypothetical protein